MTRQNVRNLILNNLRSARQQTEKARKPRSEKPVRTVTLYM